MKDTFNESQHDVITLPYDFDCEYLFFFLMFFFYFLEVVATTTKRKKLTIAISGGM